jgi:hypothetical protein
LSRAITPGKVIVMLRSSRMFDGALIRPLFALTQFISHPDLSG